MARHVELIRGADVTVVVCANLSMSGGYAMEAVVFDRIEITDGDIDTLHCLEETEIGRGTSATINNIQRHTAEELIALACKRGKLELKK